MADPELYRKVYIRIKTVFGIVLHNLKKMFQKSYQEINGCQSHVTHYHKCYLIRSCKSLLQQ